MIATAAGVLTAGFARHAVLQAMLCVAKEDPDTVWLVLHCILGAHSLHSRSNPDAVFFPDAGRLLQTQGNWIPSGNVAAVRLFVNTLLQEVESIQASWHSHCSDNQI